MSIATWLHYISLRVVIWPNMKILISAHCHAMSLWPSGVLFTHAREMHAMQCFQTKVCSWGCVCKSRMTTQMQMEKKNTQKKNVQSLGQSGLWEIFVLQFKGKGNVCCILLRAVQYWAFYWKKYGPTFWYLLSFLTNIDCFVAYAKQQPDNGVAPWLLNSILMSCGFMNTPTVYRLTPEQKTKKKHWHLS